MKFNEKIVLLRKQKGLTKEAAAFQLGMSSQVLSTWESGDCEPSFKELKKLAKMYDVSFDYLLDDDFEKTNEAPNKNSEKTGCSVYKDQFVMSCNLWFVVLIISSLIFITLILVAAFVDFHRYTGTYGFVGFLECFTLEIVILKIVMLLFLFLTIFSAAKLISNARTKKNES